MRISRLRRLKDSSSCFLRSSPIGVPLIAAIEYLFGMTLGLAGDATRLQSEVEYDAAQTKTATVVTTPIT
jgi:hypothetical protein